MVERRNPIFEKILKEFKKYVQRSGDRTLFQHLKTQKEVRHPFPPLQSSKTCLVGALLSSLVQRFPVIGFLRVVPALLEAPAGVHTWIPQEACRPDDCLHFMRPGHVVDK